MANMSFLQGREAPTKELIVGAAVRMQAETGKIRAHAKKIEEYFCQMSDASGVGTTSATRSSELDLNYKQINDSIDTLIALREVLFGKKKEPKESVAAAS